MTAEIARLAKEGPIGSRARARQDQAGSRVRVRPRAHRRVRRQGRRAQPVQHLPGRPRTRSRRTSAGIARLTTGRGAAGRGHVDRHAESRGDPLPSGEVPAAGRRADARPHDRCRRLARTGRSWRRRSRPPSSPTASSCSSSSGATCRRSTSRWSPAPAQSAIRRARPASPTWRSRPSISGTKTRKALEIEQAFGDLGTTLTGGAGRESARLGLDVLSRNLSPALGDAGRRRAESDVSRKTRSRASASACSTRSRRAIAAATRSTRASSRCWRSARTIRMAARRRG